MPDLGIPHSPGPAILDVAFRAEYVAQSAGVLIYIELQSLCGAWIFHVEVQRITKVVNVVMAADLLPPQGGSPRRAANAELRRGARERRCTDLLLQSMVGPRPIAAAAGADRTRIPTIYRLNLCDGRGRTCTGAAGA